MKLRDLNSSFTRYLNEGLAEDEIRVFDTVYTEDTGGLDWYVAIDRLKNRLGAQPKQLLFVHGIVQNLGELAVDKLDELTDKLYDLVEKGIRFNIYSYPTDQIVGEAEIVECSLSPEVKHGTGAVKRTFILGVCHEG